MAHAQTLDMDKLAKVLNLTFADREGEVLNAARMARRMLTGARMNFNDVFSFASVRSDAQAASSPESVQSVRREYETLVESLHRDYNLRIAALNRRLQQASQNSAQQRTARAAPKSASREQQEEVAALRRQIEWWKARSNQQVEKLEEKHQREIQHLNRRLDFWRNFATSERH